MLRWDNDKSTIDYIKNIAQKEYLYSPKNSLNERSWFVEDAIGKLETIISNLWPELIDEFPRFEPETGIRMALSMFAAVMILRHPITINGVAKLFERDLKGKTFLSEIKWSEQAGYVIAVDNILDQCDLLASELSEMDWAIFCTSEQRFITSDKPVMISSHANEIKIFFPLSPKRVLVMMPSGTMGGNVKNQYVQMNPEDARNINMITLDQSYEVLVSSRPMPHVLDEIRGIINDDEL